MSAIDTSIVLATCSRAGMLRDALASLLAQDWIEDHAVEMVIVDDGSTDETSQLLAELQRTASIPITVLRGARQGVAAARNLGSNAAQGSWIASFDDDQIASPTWLRELRTFADAHNAAVVGGALALRLPIGASPNAFGPRARGVLGEHLLGDTAHRYGTRLLPATNNVLIRRDVFVALNGYDTRFTEGGEDKDFFERVFAAGHAQWFNPASSALHVMTPKRLEHSNLRWTSLRLGASDVRMEQRRHPFLGPLKLAALRLGVALLRDLPQRALAKLRGDHQAMLDTSCSLWYTQGLFRALVPIVTARTGNSSFLRSIDFRTRNGERASHTLRSTQ